MRGDVFEIRQPARIARDTVAIILDLQIVTAMLPPARDDNGLGVRVDAVLDQLGDGFEGIALRERDNADRVPIIADSQFAPLRCLGLHSPPPFTCRKSVIHYTAKNHSS